MNVSIFDTTGTASRRDAIILIVCLSIALALRIAVIARQPAQLTLDRDAYLGIATSIAEGRGYSGPNSSQPTAFRPPLYPLSLGIGLSVFPPAVVVAGINLVVGLLTVWLTASLGQRLQLGPLRFMAAFLVAIDPLLLQYSSRPMTECFCTFLATLWLWSVTDACRSKSGQHPVRGIISGIAFGLLVLSRPTFWLVAGFCGLGWLITQRQRTAANDAVGTSRFWRGIWSVGGTVITVAPWVIRNWLVFGIPILTTTHGGYTLLLGNNPVFYDQVVRQPWGTTWPDASQKAWEANLESELERDLGPGASETERDAWQSRQAKSFMAAEPWRCGEATIHRIHSLWNTIPQGDAATDVNRWVLMAVEWFYRLVLTAGVVGMVLVLARPERVKWWPFLVLIMSVQIVHLFYWTNTRMRAPLTPAIALFAVAAIPRKRVE